LPNGARFIGSLRGQNLWKTGIFLFEKPVPEIGGQLGVWQQETWDIALIKAQAARHEMSQDIKD